MHTLVKAGAAVAAIVALAGCSAPAASPFQQAVVEAADRYGVTLNDDLRQRADDLGAATCSDLASGASLDQVRASTRDASLTPDHLRFIDAVVLAASEHLCGER